MATSAAEPARGRAKLAAWLVGWGFLAMVLAFFRAAEPTLDSYILPKEVVMHACALVAVVLLVSTGRGSVTRADLFLWAALAISLLSAALVAQNRWWAHRALSLSSSGALLFWVARHLARRGHGPVLQMGVAAGLVALAAATLAEAHGILPELSMPGRLPGGPGGNRNFTAHLLVLGLPLLAQLAAADEPRPRAVWWWLGLVLSTCVIVVSRSRAAWLGAGTLAATVAVVTGCTARPPRISRAMLTVVGALALGLLLAAVPARRARWHSETPYEDTFSRLLDASTGTGRGRLRQYAATVRIVEAHPILGVGPSNWSSAYARQVTVADPSYDPRSFRPVNRLPNSDVLGMAAERGALVVLLLAAAGASLLGWARSCLKRGERGPRMNAAVSICCLLAATLVMGLFDAVLLRPEPVYFVSVLLGVCARDLPTLELGWPSRRVRLAGLALVLTSTAVAAVAAAAQATSVYLRSDADQRAGGLITRLDPGDYSRRAWLAHQAALAGDCAAAHAHAGQARRLFSRPGGLAVVRRLCPDHAGPDVSGGGPGAGYRIVFSRGPLRPAEAQRAAALVERAFQHCVRRFGALPEPGLVIDLNPALNGVSGRFDRVSQPSGRLLRTARIRYPELAFLGMDPEELVTHELCHDHAPYAPPYAEGVPEWAVGRAWGVELAPWWGRALEDAGLWVPPRDLFIDRTFVFKWDTVQGRAAYYLQTPLLIDFLVRTYGWPRVHRLLREDGRRPRAGRDMEDLFQRSLGFAWDDVHQAWSSEIERAVVPAPKARKLLFSVRLYNEVKRFEVWQRTARGATDEQLAPFREAFTAAALSRDRGDLDRAAQELERASGYLTIQTAVVERRPTNPARRTSAPSTLR